MKKHIFFMFLLVLALFSCREETTIEDTTKTPIGEETNFDITAYGQVVTLDGTPIEDVFVSGDGESHFTDVNGLFLFQNISAGNLGTHISATKEGYLYGGVRIYADAMGTHRMEIVMMEAMDLGDVDPSTGGTIKITENTTVSFPINAFTLNGSDPYTGNVNVLGNWIDPTSERMLDLVPGDLSGVDTDGDRVVLNSFGMMGVELRTDSGEEIEIIEGQNASLEFEVPIEILSYATDEIPLWFFDEDLGIWVEEGSATLQGDKYVGDVSHFTWWNCDLPFSILPFCIHITDINTGNSLANTDVYFENLNGFGQAGGITDSRGYLCGFIPEDMQLMVTIGDQSICPGQLPTKEVGPFTTADLPIVLDCPVDLGDIVLNTINGNVMDCTSGNPVADAFVLFDDSNGVITDSGGNYSQDLISCGTLTDLSVRAIDLVSEKEATLTLSNLSGGTHTADLSLCDDLTDFDWFITSTNGSFSFNDVVAKVKPNETLVYSDGANTTELLGFDCSTVGTCSGSYAGTVGAFSVNVTISEFGNVGGSIKGSFEGTDNSGAPVSGSFTAERVE